MPARSFPDSPSAAPILFFPLLADALLTLLYRARRGRSLFVAHAEHIYQIAIISGVSHVRIALIYWAAMAACGAIAIAASRDATHVAPAVALLALSGIAVAIDFAVRDGVEARSAPKR